MSCSELSQKPVKIFRRGGVSSTIRHLKIVVVCGSVEPRGDNMDMVETQSCTSHEITSI